MGIEEPEIVDLVRRVEELEQKLCAHPLHKVCHLLKLLLVNLWTLD